MLVRWLRILGGVFESVLVGAGVRQGCPLSALLFVAAVDPFLRAMRRAMDPTSIHRAFADDVGLVLTSLWREGPAIANAFTQFETVSALGLGHAKCILIPILGLRCKRLGCASCDAHACVGVL